MGIGLTFAIMAALCSGSAAILQAVSARRVLRSSRVDPRLLLRLLRQRGYAAGLGLDTASFLFTMLALRSAPLFAVQALTTANLAVVACLARLLLRQRLRPVDWSGVGSVVAGALMLVLAARPGAATPLVLAGRWAVLGAALALAVVAFLTPRVRSAAFPGLLAGLAYGDSSVAARVLGPLGHSAVELAASPLTYAVVIASLLGTLLYATALQQGSVTAASGLATVGQTIGPALAGWFLLGDGVHAGMGPVGLMGFVLAVAGAVTLGRHAHGIHHHRHAHGGRHSG